MKSVFPVRNRKLRNVTQVSYTEHLILKKIYWRCSESDLYFLWKALPQRPIDSVSKSFPKDDIFYHIRLGTDIFLASDWFYYSFYGCKTSLLTGDIEKQLWRKKSSWICFFFQNSDKAIFSRRHLRFEQLFLKFFLSVCLISVYNQCLNAIVLPGCSAGVCWCSVGVPLFRHFSGVFRVSVFLVLSYAIKKCNWPFRLGDRVC